MVASIRNSIDLVAPTKSEFWPSVTKNYGGTCLFGNSRISPKLSSSACIVFAAGPSAWDFALLFSNYIYNAYILRMKEMIVFLRQRRFRKRFEFFSNFLYASIMKKKRVEQRERECEGERN